MKAIRRGASSGRTGRRCRVDPFFNTTSLSYPSGTPEGGAIPGEGLAGTTGDSRRSASIRTAPFRTEGIIRRGGLPELVHLHHGGFARRVSARNREATPPDDP